MTSDVQGRAERLLKDITPGEWRRGQEGNWRVYGPDGSGEHAGLLAVVHKTPANADFIAAAPQLVRDLLTLVQQLEAERDEARKQLRETQPCEVCRWPRPMDIDHNICECCGFQPSYNDAEAYRAAWDGRWWFTDERYRHLKPVILEAAEAKLATYEAGIARLEQEMRDSAVLLANSPILALHGYAYAIQQWADSLAALRAGDPQA